MAPLIERLNEAHSALSQSVDVDLPDAIEFDDLDDGDLSVIASCYAAVMARAREGLRRTVGAMDHLDPPVVAL